MQKAADQAVSALQPADGNVSVKTLAYITRAYQTFTILEYILIMYNNQRLFRVYKFSLLLNVLGKKLFESHALGTGEPARN